jgi:hypothetical protein
MGGMRGGHGEFLRYGGGGTGGGWGWPWYWVGAPIVYADLCQSNADCGTFGTCTTTGFCI